MSRRSIQAERTPAGAAIPLARPDLGGNEEAYVVDALRSSWISATGKYVDLFEAKFAGVCGTRTAISVTNGTAALVLLLKGMGVGPGDEIIIPSLTFVATANAVRAAGAEPVFAEVEPVSWCLAADRIAELVTPKTKGIIAVHLYGHPADMDAVNEAARRAGLWVIEDAAQAHGARYKGRPVGGLAAGAAFSFHGSKILTCGEGGAITLQDARLEALLRSARGHGSDVGRRYYFTDTGYNFRLSNMACALLCAQIEHMEEGVRQRRRIFEGYRARLAGVPGIGFQPKAEWADPAPWLFCITVDAGRFGLRRDRLIERLSAAGIETRPFFVPIHSLPPYRDSAGARRTELSSTESLAASGICLPTYAGLSEEDQDRVAAAIRDSVR